MSDTTSSTNDVGLRYDTGKVRMDLLPWAALSDVAQVLTVGADKYAPYNWAKGMHWSKVIGPLFRHLAKWMMGERYDAESGLPHLAHVACNVLFLMTYERFSLGQDDRWLPPKQENTAAP